jgi:hypothetical protein
LPHEGLEAKIGDFVAHYNHLRYHKASPISLPPMSTLDEANPSCLNEKGSNDRPFRIDVVTIAARPLNITQQMHAADEVIE